MVEYIHSMVNEQDCMHHWGWHHLRNVWIDRVAKTVDMSKYLKENLDEISSFL